MAGEKKLFVGARLRRLRKSLGLTQAAMADELGISTSYLNLIERNQRPLSAQLLLRLAEVYDFDVRHFGGTEEARALAGLREVLSDPLFRGLDIGSQDLEEVAAASPRMADAISALYRAYRDAMLKATGLSERLADRDRVALLEESAGPVEDVREMIHAARNHFPALDEAAETLAAEIEPRHGDLYSALATRLGERHGVAVQIAPADVMMERLRFYDRHRRRLMLSELLPQSGRLFQLAWQIGLFERAELIDAAVAESGIAREDSKRLARVALANYFAAALLMPYEPFLKAAESLRYDIEALAHRFSTSYEQVCHRLTTMQRPGARGIPFFFIRIDNAGNVSKRFSAGRFHFSKFGGTCPLWNVHESFQTPGRIYTQIIRLPDETTYFSIARTVRRSGGSHARPAQQLAIALGCDISYARRLVYADGHDLENPRVTPIGINCLLCERPDCSQRALPPLNRNFVVDERVRGLSPFAFDRDG
ncbi:MAG: short-chain fatty acyl-CoA regulator family protein [Rhodothalassiaceae bacterium]